MQKPPKPEQDRNKRRTGAETPSAGDRARIHEAVARDLTLGALWLQLFDDADP